MRSICQRISSKKPGSMLILALVFLLLGAMLLPPLLSYMGTALKHTGVYQQRTQRLYAADAGLMDAKWKIKYDKLGSYSPYDFTNSFSYVLQNEVSDLVNGSPVDVSIKNVWMPTDGTGNPSDTLNTPPVDPAVARQLIAGVGGNPPKLVISSSVTTPYLDRAHPGSIEVKIQYYPGRAEDLRIKKIGVWLPIGFTFREELGSNIDNYDIAWDSPQVVDHAGGQALIWTFNDYPYTGDGLLNLAAFPADSSGTPLSLSGSPPLVSKVTFKYDASSANSSPQCMAWINTNLDLSGGGNLTYTWDANLQIYQITSVADSNTRVETYVPKNQVRTMGSAMSGDYYAGGNSLMIDIDQDPSGIRDQILSSSETVVAAIPPDAEVASAYLYWSAWRNSVPLLLDEGDNLDRWGYGSAWSSDAGRLQAHYVGGGVANRYLTLKNSLDLSGYAAGSVFFTWDQSVNGNLNDNDALNYSFSINGGTTWSSDYQAFKGNIGSSPQKYTCVIPVQFLKSDFRLRYNIDGFSGAGQNLYLDNIHIGVLAADVAATLEIDDQPVRFDQNDIPIRGTGDLMSSKTQVLPNYLNSAPHGYSYSCFRDVTELVRAFGAKGPSPVLNTSGNGRYRVGGVLADSGDEWSYAGWSIIIIYSSPATAGHQLYLYDKFQYGDVYSDIDFDGDGKFGGTISGFLVPSPIAGDPDPDAARITCFVGEGDQVWTGDFLALNAPESNWAYGNSDPSQIPDSYKLWDGINSATGDPKTSNTAIHPNNVWNGKSMGLSADGVDIDTFHVPWMSAQNPNGISAGDTSAHFDIATQVDSWNLLYVILSFRSTAVTGGNLNYLVH